MKKSVLVVSLFMLVALFAAPSIAFDEVTPSEAYDEAISDPNAYILDVRQAEEWKWVAHPGPNGLGEGAALAGKVVNIPIWIMKNGSWTDNKKFLKDIEDVFGEGFDGVLITMCRSGDRGRVAAALLEGAGYVSRNISSGFEGIPDAAGYRRTVNGWIFEELPYTYKGAGYVK